MTKDAKLKIYPAVVISLLGLGLIAWLLSRFEVRVSIGRESLPGMAQGDSATGSSSDAAISTNPDIPPAPQSIAQPTAPATIAPTTTTPSTVSQGKLRVSNPTNHPVRVALLPQASETNAAGTTDKTSETGDRAFGQPVHWDFAPGEGSTTGLAVTLPNGEAELQAGDVLVVFAQDGSRRYWGPYVLGETAQPGWNGAATEWLLVIQP